MTAERRPLLDGPPPIVVGTFTASLLLDVLSLVAETPQRALSYQRDAADLLTSGLNGVLASVALELVDDLLVPATSFTSSAARQWVVSGAVIAVYLLDVAARRTRLGSVRTGRESVDTAPIGLSLLGLTLLGVSGERK
jgi:hypothetical protein